MEFDTEKIKGLLSKEDNSMNHENGMYMPVAPLSSGHNNDGGFGGNNSFLGMLLAWGLIDRNGNKTGQNATEAQVAQLSNQLGLSTASITSSLQALQISICNQTGEITGEIHSASTQNLVGLNALGEKVSGVGYMVGANAKDIEKTTLIDGGLTRKNSDDNANRNLIASTSGFNSVEKALCDISYKGAETACEIKGLIKDVNYNLAKEFESKGNMIIAQATNNHNDVISLITESRNEALITDKNNQIRILETAARLAQTNEIKEEIEELKCERKRSSEQEILSNNILIGNKTAIAENSFNNRMACMERAIADLTNFFSNNKIIGNSLSIGGKHNDTGIGN